MDLAGRHSRPPDHQCGLSSRHLAASWTSSRKSLVCYPMRTRPFHWHQGKNCSTIYVVGTCGDGALTSSSDVSGSSADARSSRHLSSSSPPPADPIPDLDQRSPRTLQPLSHTCNMDAQIRTRYVVCGAFRTGYGKECKIYIPTKQWIVVIFEIVVRGFRRVLRRVYYLTYDCRN